MMAVLTDRTDPVEETAFAWLAELNGGETSMERMAAFQTWTEADPAHRTAFAQAQALWRDLDWSEALNAEALAVASTRNPPARPRRRPRAAAHTPRTPRGRRWLATGAAAAACITLALMIGPGMRLLLDAVQVQTFETATGAGDIRRIELSDGSHVTLGGRSSLKVRMTRTGRLVELTDGDAYFEVASDRARPFVVTAGELTATALGTAFEVNHGGRRTQVGVTHGRVRAVTADREAVLGAGQRARLLSGASLVVEPFDPATAGRWRDQRAAFHNTPLGQVIEDLNRYHPAGVVLADPTLADLPVSAAFRLGQMEIALNGLALSHDLVVRRDAQGRLVLDRRRPLTR